MTFAITTYFCNQSDSAFSEHNPYQVKTHKKYTCLSFKNSVQFNKMTNDSKADCLWLTLNILVGLEWPTTKRQSEESVPERSRSIRSKSGSDLSETHNRSKSSLRSKNSNSTSENEDIDAEFVVVLPKIDCR